MKRFIIAGLVALSLSSCTTLDDINGAIKAGVPYVCSAARPFHSAFLLSVATGKVKQSLIDKEAIAFAQLEEYCNAPEKATLISTLDAVTAAFLAIKNASIEAKRQVQE